MSRITARWSASSLSQRVGYVFGAVYVLVGLAGFVVTNGIGFAETSGSRLLFFELNPLHNLVHIGIGAALAGAAYAGPRWSRDANLAVGAVYLVVGLAGLFVAGTGINILALNQADNGLHVASAVVLVGSALYSGRRRSDATSDVIRHKPEGAFVGGEDVPETATYRCSCNDFAVFVREGMTFPECPQGQDHHYQLMKRPKARAKSA